MAPTERCSGTARSCGRHRSPHGCSQLRGRNLSTVQNSLPQVAQEKRASLARYTRGHPKLPQLPSPTEALFHDDCNACSRPYPTLNGSHPAFHLSHPKAEHPQSSHDNERSACEHAPHEARGNDGVARFSWGSLHDGAVNRFHTEGLRRWAVHDDVDPQDLCGGGVQRGEKRTASTIHVENRRLRS